MRTQQRKEERVVVVRDMTNSSSRGDAFTAATAAAAEPLASQLTKPPQG